MRNLLFVALVTLFLIAVAGCGESEYDRQQTLTAEAALVRAQTDQIRAEQEAQEAAHRRAMEMIPIALVVALLIVSLGLVFTLIYASHTNLRQNTVYYVLLPGGTAQQLLSGANNLPLVISAAGKLQEVENGRDE